MNESKIELIEGSSNVFRDLGDPEADLKHAKAVLAHTKRRSRALHAGSADEDARGSGPRSANHGTCRFETPGRISDGNLSLARSFATRHKPVLDASPFRQGGARRSFGACRRAHPGQGVYSWVAESSADTLRHGDKLLVLSQRKTATRLVQACRRMREVSLFLRTWWRPRE